MSYKILSIAHFDKQLKRLVKKYPSLKVEYLILMKTLAENPGEGTSIGHDCYKIRLAIASKGKGKSGGARVITYVAFIKNEVYLLSIYDKSEAADIADKELLRLLEIAK
ncbi:MAG: type II toxin-antitoxin system RelE/ParE family toxin [Sphingobacteriales bacterium]